MPRRASSFPGTQLRAFSVRGAAEWSHPCVASKQLPGSGESEPVAARPEIPTSFNLQGAVAKGIPEPREFHPQRERVRQAGRRGQGRGSQTPHGRGLRGKPDPGDLQWLPLGSRRGTPGVVSISSPFKQLSEQLLGGKLDQWRRPEIFLIP